MKKKVSKAIDVGQELRNLGVLIEHNNDKISAVAEQYQSINETLGSHTTMIEGLTGDMKTVKQTLNSHTEMIGELAVDVEVVKTNVELIKGSLKKKVDYDEFIALERRVHSLEAKGK